MRVDGREIGVSGSLLQPMPRRTNDILRLILATVLLALIITSSLITRPRWVALEKSISEIVGVLSPTQSNVVYLIYGIAILALPFVILIALIISRQWKLLGRLRGRRGARDPAVLDQRQRHRGAPMALRPLGPAQHGAGAIPRRPALDRDAGGGADRVRAVAAGALAALVVDAAAGVRADPPRRQRHRARPAVAVGLAVGWFVGALVVLVVGTPALEVPLDDAVRAMARRGFVGVGLTVVRPAGPGPLVLVGRCRDPERRRWSRCTARINAAAAHCASSGARCRLRDAETAPLQTSMRRAVEHRALMAIAIGELGVANTETIAVAALDRGWTLYAHKAHSRDAARRMRDDDTGRESIWESLRTLHDYQISHGDLRGNEITVDDGAVLFGGFGSAEYGATDVQLQSDIAQLLVTTSALYDAESAVGAAIDAFGKDAILTASRRLTKSAVPTTDPELASPIPAGVMSSAARRGEAPNGRRQDQDRDDHPVHPRPGHSAGAARRAGLRRVSLHQHGAHFLLRAATTPTGGGRCWGWRCRR